ncbi:MAG: peptide ABC transporter substrate-binding protein, partial [Leptospiraceae bacterium]|nr:peptide ABC transporter substrate-binding protein [Leptospiraceae bacterium]
IILFLFLNQFILGQDDKKKIEVLISSDNRIYEQGLYGIQSVSDFELKVSYLDIVTSENPDIASYFKNIDDSGIPFFITIGPAATKIAKENLKKTPIIFSMVNAPKSLGLENDNVCGVSMDISVSEFFQTLNDIDPNIKTIQSFYSTEDGEYSAGEGEYTDLKYKLLFNKKKITDKKDFKKELSSLAGKIDAFLMVNDPLYGKNEFEELSKFCKENKIILMTSFPALVKVGATFGISPDYSKIGVLTGMMANRIHSKSSNCEKERVQLPDQSSFFLNEDYAKASGIEIPNSIVERAKLTRLFDVGISLINEGKLNSAKTVFDAILKKDPGNKSASSFQQLIIEKQSGTKTKELLASAEKHMQNRNYAQARAEFQRVLAINPNIASAREGIQTSLQAQSEQERSIGNEHARSGRPFEAIKMFLASLRTLPTNAKAQNDLNTIRNFESSNMKTYIKSGISEYNERNYEKAIDIFENALLVVPGSKEAQEYLRLSHKKKEAIITLKKKLGVENKN